MKTLSKAQNNTKSSILIVDDSQEALVVNKILLESEGFEVTSAQSGAEAIDTLLNFNLPNLILLDMQMEDMNGIEFLKILEMKYPHISKKVPVVFLTGMNFVPSSRASGFIRKPWDIDTFAGEVSRFIEKGVK